MTAGLAWIAPRVCGAGVLLLIHKSCLEAAAIEVISQGTRYRNGEDWLEVEDATVRHRLGGALGETGVEEVVDYAVSRYRPEAGRALARAYRNLVEAIEATKLNAELNGCERRAAAELCARTRAWWGSPEADCSTAPSPRLSPDAGRAVEMGSVRVGPSDPVAASLRAAAPAE